MSSAYEELAMGIGKGVLAAAGISAGALATLGIAKATGIIARTATGPAAQTGVAAYTASQTHGIRDDLKNLTAEMARPRVGDGDSAQRQMADDIRAMAVMQGARIAPNAMVPVNFGVPGQIVARQNLAAQESYRQAMMTGVAKKSGSGSPVIYGR